MNQKKIAVFGEGSRIPLKESRKNFIENVSMFHKEKTLIKTPNF